MADKQLKKNLSSKLDSLQSIINNLKEQNEILQKRKSIDISRRVGKSVKRLESTLLSQQSKLENEGKLNVEVPIQEKHRYKCIKSDNTIVTSKLKNVDNMPDIEKWDDRLTVLKTFSTISEETKKVTPTGQVESRLGDSDERLSKLAKLVWSERTSKLNFSPIWVPVTPRVSNTNHNLQSKTILTVPKIKIHNNLHRKHFHKDLSLTTDPSIVGVSPRVGSQCQRQSNQFLRRMDVPDDRAVESFKNSVAETSKVAETRADSDINASGSIITLKDTSDRLSVLARETWNKSVLSKTSKLNHNRKMFKVTRRSPITSDYHQKRHVGFSVEGSAKKWKQPNSTVSTNDRLSELAKQVWQKQIQQRGPNAMNGHRFRYSHQSRYQFKSSWNNPRLKRALATSTWRPTRTHVSSFFSRRKRVVLKTSRFKVVRRDSALRSAPRRNAMHKRLKTVKESNILFTNVHGKKFVTDTKGRRLKRLSSSSSNSPHVTAANGNHHRYASMALHSRSSSGSVYSPNRYIMIRRHGTAHTHSTKMAVASRVIKKSVFRIQQQNARKFVKKQYCMFYNRFGKCKNGNRCRYIHDPDKVAVCTRFLRGTCKDEKCLFSHKVDSRKMPTCFFFLNGGCQRENCPYNHVKVSSTADICEEFLKGYCPVGDKCPKRHILECDQFSEKGKCTQGDSCKLYHRKRKSKRRRSSSLSGTKMPKPFTKRKKPQRKSDEFGITVVDEDLKIKPTFSAAESTDRTIAGLTRLKRKRRFDWKRGKEDETE